MSDVSRMLDLLAQNPDALKEFGDFNRSIVEKYYSVSKMVADYTKVYETLAP
jgi:hypothetical protein